MPYPTEHTARIKDPKQFVRFRRKNNFFKSGIHAIFGIKSNNKAEIQSIRFDKEKYTVVQAKKWLKDNDFHPIRFEPASGGKDMKEKYTMAEVKQVNKDGSIRFRLTSKKVDRAGEVVLPDGIELENFKNNPIVLFGHGFRNNVPIGKIDIDSFKITKSYVDANVIFDEEGKDPFAEMIGDKVRNGFLNAGSIGFRPTVVGNDPVLPKQTGATIQEWELFEFSIVPVPANVDALARREFYNECKSLIPDLDDSIFTPPLEIESTPGITNPSLGLIDTIEKFTPDLIEEAKKLIEKSGRVLSSKNRTLVKNVADSMESLLGELKALLAATEPKSIVTDGNDINAIIEEQNRRNDVLIKNTLESIGMAKLINNINDIKKIVS